MPYYKFIPRPTRTGRTRWLWSRDPVTSLTPAAINVTTTVTATVNVVYQITPASVNVTTTVSGSVTKFVPVTPASINVTTTVSGLVVLTLVGIPMVLFERHTPRRRMVQRI